MNRKPYPTDLTDAQWQAIEPCFTNCRNRKWDKRELVNTALYITKTGCQMIFHHMIRCGAFIAEPINQACGIKSFWHWFKKMFSK